VYDGNVAATVSTAATVLTGLVAGDKLTVSAIGAFLDKNVGTGKIVTLTNNYTGADVTNYSITGQFATHASITAAALTLAPTPPTKLGIPTEPILGATTRPEPVDTWFSTLTAPRSLGQSSTITVIQSCTDTVHEDDESSLGSCNPAGENTQSDSGAMTGPQLQIVNGGLRVSHNMSNANE
jgi:hypothetical protein